MTNTPKRLRKINALSQNKNLKHPAMQRINEEMEQCCPHAVVSGNCRSLNFTRTGRTGCPPGAMEAVAFAKLIGSRRSHAERCGEIAQFATCHREWQLAVGIWEKQNT